MCPVTEGFNCIGFPTGTFTSTSLCPSGTPHKNGNGSTGSGHDKCLSMPSESSFCWGVCPIPEGFNHLGYPSGTLTSTSIGSSGTPPDDGGEDTSNDFDEPDSTSSKCSLLREVCPATEGFNRLGYPTLTPTLTSLDSSGTPPGDGGGDINSDLDEPDSTSSEWSFGEKCVL